MMPPVSLMAFYLNPHSRYIFQLYGEYCSQTFSGHSLDFAQFSPELWTWVVALDCNYQNYSILMRLVKHFKNLANTLQTAMGDHRTAAHPL